MLNHQIYSQINQFEPNYQQQTSHQQNCVSARPQYIQQSNMKKKNNQFRVQIRNNQLKDIKEKIRQQVLKTDMIERLIEQMPFDNQSATSWAHELLKLYGQTLQYKLTIDKAVDLFKLVEKFPNKCTLQLFELVVMRASKDSIDMLFQYDVMRLLHSFINFTGKDRKIRSPKSSSSFQQMQIVKQVVISDEVVKSMEKNNRNCSDYDEKIQITKCVLRIIGQLCRKDQRVRNFAVINHKTYTYCLKAYMYYQKAVQIQFLFFLQAATYQSYNSKGGDQQLNRLTMKIIRFFFKQKIDIKVELLDEGRSSYFYRYELLMKAMKNILNMKSQWINTHILNPQDEQGDPLIATSLLSLLKQCNYVISFPAVKGVEDRLLPGKLLASLIELIMLVIELLEVEQKSFSKFPYLYQEIIVLLSQAKIGLGDMSFTIARRGCYFLISNIFCEHLNPQIFRNLIYYSDQNPKSNIISLLRFLLEIESNYQNKQEISVIFLKLFENGYPHIIQPLLLQNDILSLFFQMILLGNTNYTQNSLVFCDQIVKINVIQTIATFFNKMGSSIGQKILYYRQLVLSQYERRLSSLMMSDQCSENLYRYASAMLSIIKSSNIC